MIAWNDDFSLCSGFRLKRKLLRKKEKEKKVSVVDAVIGHELSPCSVLDHR